MKKITEILVFTTYILMMCFAGGCKQEKNELVHDHEHEHEHEHHHDDEHVHGDGQEIILEPEQAEKMGVKTEVVYTGMFSDALQVTGKITNSTPNQASIAAPTPGFFTFAPGITSGMTVGKGQLIGTIKATDITGNDRNATDLAYLNNAKKELERLDSLYKKQFITADKYYAALAEYEIAKSKYSPVAASGEVRAPEGGILIDVLARQGQYVDAGSEIARIADSSTLTLIADVPEKYASKIGSISNALILQSGSSAPVDLSSLGGKKLTSASSITSKPGYIPVVFTFRNDKSFVPGSVTEVYLLGEKRPQVIAVPLSAISEQQGQYFVYVKIDDEGYIKTPVTLGARDGKSIEILSGLKIGDVIVSQGVTALRLAETSGAVPEGHSHSH